MQTDDEVFERLRAAIQELAADDATELLLEARAEARERVRALLSDALTTSMLARVDEHVELSQSRLERPDLGWYVHCVIASEDATPGPAVAGIDPAHSVTVLREGPVAAVASPVSLEDFGETPLRAHLADAEWVERTSRAHERTLEQIGATTTLVPIRMCTVCRTEGGVRERLRRDARSLEHALAHLRGKDEWSVKIFADLYQGDDSVWPDPLLLTNDSPGRPTHLIEEACARVHERLCAVASDGLVAPTQSVGAAARGGELIMGGVYLVDDRVLPDFHDQVRDLRRQLGRLGIELQLTGPGPAYNFVPGGIGAAW